MVGREQSPFVVASPDRARRIRSVVAQVVARTVAAVVGTDYLDERDKKDLVEDISARATPHGLPLLRCAYRLGREGDEAVEDSEQRDIERLESAADAAIRSQFVLIERALKSSFRTETVDEAALGTLVAAARAMLNRVFAAEVVGAVNLGRAHALARLHGPDVQVAKRVSPAACATCRATHTLPDGTPRAVTLSSLVASRTITLVSGRPTAAPATTIGPAHPGCMCILELADASASARIGPSLAPDVLMRSIELYKAGDASDRSVSRIDFQGLPIVIENAPGTVRSWRSATGREGTTTLLYAYGYIEGTIGGEGEELDVFVGPSPASPYVYIVHQSRPDAFGTGEWDEDKILLGFDNVHDATRAYMLHYDDPRFLGSVSMMTFDDFRTRLPQRGGYIGSLDVEEESPALEENKPKILIRPSAEFLRSLERDGFLSVPDVSQYSNREVHTGVAGPSMAALTPIQVSRPMPDGSKDYKDMAEETAREKARWQIRIDPNILFMRQDSASRPVHPIEESDIAKLAADLDTGFMHDVRHFLDTQTRARTLAQNSGAPNVDPPRQAEVPAAEKRNE